MYVTSNEYLSITGRPASEATTIRINISSKLLDSRIGNYPIYNSTGFKIKISNGKFYMFGCGVDTEINISKKQAVQQWVCKMISFLTDNGDKPPSQSDNIKLGRFSVGKSGAASNNTLIPDEMSFVDSILISSGIINRKVKMR